MKTSKNITNIELAELLRNIAASYKLKDPSKYKFQTIAYERAADAIEHLSSEAKDLFDEGKLEEIPAIGKSIANHLSEIFKTGKSKHFESLLDDIHPAIFELIKIPGIGPKTAQKLTLELNISSKDPISQLEILAKEGKIEKLENFGKDSQEEILKNVSEHKKKPKARLLLPKAENIAEMIIAWMKKNKHTESADPLGSLRRRASTVGDIDISVATKNPKKVIDHFTNYPKKTRVLKKGDTKASIICPGNIQIDLMTQSPNSYGSLLQHFTGSKHHNIALREHAIKKGLSLSEYGIKKHGNLKKYRTEKDFYKALGMDLIPPELREDTGELEAALNHKLPVLIEEKDIISDLHIHSDFNIETSHDYGESSMQELTNLASNLGYEYIAFTEHNPSQRGHTEKEIVEILKLKREKVEKLNYSISRNERNRVQKVFNSLEIDILPDGTLPLKDKSLETLDFALVSIHSSFKLSREKMTQRVLRALSHPKVKIFAHPTARKINHREGVELNWEKIFDFCLKNNKWIEINASPMRLDLPDFLVREATKLGIKLTLGTDSHHKDHLKYMKYAVSVARRGWATKKDVINTKTLNNFEKLLKS